MTGTPIPPTPIVTSGFEYNIVPGSIAESPSGSWASVEFSNLPDAIELNGYRISSRYYVERCVPSSLPGGGPSLDPDGNQIYVCTKTFPEWELISQTLVKTSPSRQVFDTNTGHELFTSTPGTYIGWSDEAGIIDGTSYVYVRVFDQADISYIPRASTINQPVITQPTTMPSGPEKYLIDTITSFVPDERESVTIQYTLTTIWGDGLGSETSEVMTISHEVTQDTGDAGSKLKAYLERSYYGDGKYHIQLHDMEEQDLYDSGGELVRPEAYKVPVYNGKKLVNSVTPVTSDDILNEVFGTGSQELMNLVNMIDDYKFPE